MQIKDIKLRPGSISIDSRKIKKGDIFVAIKGERFDGHDFVRKAFEKGASLAIISRTVNVPSKVKEKLIKTKNTISALGDIAKRHREKFKIPVIAITGSNGKTTTKELVAHVLSAKYSVLKTKASENSFIGLPLTLTRLNEGHDIAVLEIGMNHKGEINKLSKIARPSVGVVTNIASAHIGILGTLCDIAKAKSELLANLPKNGLAILNADDRKALNMKNLKCKKIYFGLNAAGKFMAQNIHYKNNKWHFSLRGNTFTLPLLGKHNIYNALVAVIVAKKFGISFSKITQRLEAFKNTPPKRLELKKIKGVNILDDSYNSNPTSMEKALDTLMDYNAPGKKIVISSDMLELGKRAKFLHESIGRLVASKNIDALITLGKMARFTNKKAKEGGLSSLYHASSHRKAACILNKIARKGDIVLVKGSRKMQTEKVIEKFREV